jgi:PAS domain S-box-containing protein
MKKRSPAMKGKPKTLKDESQTSLSRRCESEGDDSSQMPRLADAIEVLRGLACSSTQCVVRLVNDRGTLLLINDSHCSLVDERAENLLGQPFTIMFASEDSDFHLKRFCSLVLGRKSPGHIETHYVLRNGRRVWFEEEHLFLRLGAENVLVLTICRDITGRKTADEHLTHERNLLRTLIESMPDKIYIKDSNCRYVMNNRAHLQSLGLTKQEECFGKSAFDFFPQELAQRFYADEQILLKSGEPLIGREEEISALPGEDSIWHLTTKVPLRDGHGNISGLIGISRDITGLKRLQIEREGLIADLQKALVSIKRLNGLVPICAWCKRIRKDDGYWASLEQYIVEHSEAVLSHGICPDCARRVEPPDPVKS